jgi:NitT/TauT family transport system substrate-binding protein
MRRLLLIPAILALLLSACGGMPTPASVDVKIGVLPILDALPMYVADSQGYFRQHNLQVEFVPVSSAAERDQLMQAGQIDGMINDLISTMLYDQNATQIVIVSFARTATPKFPQYRILAAKDSGILTAADLKNVPIGISEGTVIEYVTDRLLEAEGLAPAEIKTLPVPKIPDRMALLGSGELKAATLPDPLSSLAIQSGAKVIIDDTAHPELGNSVISFRQSFISEHPEAVKAFLSAVEQGVKDVNADKGRWSDLLTQKQLVPESLIGSYDIPTFPTASVPSETQFDDALKWTQERGLVSANVPYGQSVDASYLPLP